MVSRSVSYADDEHGVIRKKWHGRIRVALAYPNQYPVGMANLGFQTVYRLLNELDDVVCERAFLPETGIGKPIRTMESGRTLSEFDVIAFSISFENDFPGLLSILKQAGIPLLASHRGPPFPLVMAGGVACFLNPEPIAPFVDCFLLGEAEAVLPEFFDGFDPGSDRKSHLGRLARDVAGTYVPAFYEAAYHPDGTLKRFTPTADVPPTISRRTMADLSETPACSTVLTPHTPFKDRFLIEVARGCPHGCRFCSAGYVYRPPRFRPAKLLERCLAEGAARTDKIGLVGTAVSDLPGLSALCGAALDRKLSVSFSSLRTDALTPEIVSVLKHGGVKTATLAPDAGSERMRRVINKGISETDVLTAVEYLVAGGIPNLKLYFMVGLPTETADDVAAIVELCRKIKEGFLSASRRRKRIGTITVSLNAFVPKAVTPFQWSAMEPVPVLKKKFRKIREGLKRVANVTVKTDPLRRDVVQALLARGDRRVADMLIRHRQTGGNWPETLKAVSPRPGFYVNRVRSTEENLPWDFIDHGIRKSFLAREYRRAMQGKPSSPCPIDNCNVCGVCD